MGGPYSRPRPPSFGECNRHVRAGAARQPPGPHHPPPARRYGAGDRRGDRDGSPADDPRRPLQPAIDRGLLPLRRADRRPAPRRRRLGRGRRRGTRAVPRRSRRRDRPAGPQRRRPEASGAGGAPRQGAGAASPGRSRGGARRLAADRPPRRPRRRALARGASPPPSAPAGRRARGSRHGGRRAQGVARARPRGGPAGRPDQPGERREDARDPRRRPNRRGRQVHGGPRPRNPSLDPPRSAAGARRERADDDRRDALPRDRRPARPGGPHGRVPERPTSLAARSPRRRRRCPDRDRHGGWTGVAFGDADIAAITELLLGLVRVGERPHRRRRTWSRSTGSWPRPRSASTRRSPTTISFAEPGRAPPPAPRPLAVRPAGQQSAPAGGPRRYPDVYQVASEILAEVGPVGDGADLPVDEIGLLTMYLAGSLERTGCAQDPGDGRLPGGDGYGVDPRLAARWRCFPRSR